MTRQSGGGDRNRPKGNPNQDVQPWLGWIAAFLVVIVVVVAVALGMERTNMQRTGSAEVRMTPLVGGMQLPVSTETPASVAASEITPLPADTTVDEGASTDAITGTEVITAVVIPPVVILSETEMLTDTEAVTETLIVSASEIVTETVAAVEDEVTAIGEISSTEEVSSSAIVSEGVEEVPPVAATPRPRPTPRSSPTPQLPAVERVFDIGDLLIADAASVAIHADASQESMVLNSFGVGFVVEVIEPSGDYVAYPVSLDGFGWVRVRSADGLVGWVRTDQVERL